MLITAVRPVCRCVLPSGPTSERLRHTPAFPSVPMVILQMPMHPAPADLPAPMTSSLITSPPLVSSTAASCVPSGTRTPRVQGPVWLCVQERAMPTTPIRPASTRTQLPLPPPVLLPTTPIRSPGSASSCVLLVPSQIMRRVTASQPAMVSMARTMPIPFCAPAPSTAVAISSSIPSMVPTNAYNTALLLFSHRMALPECHPSASQSAAP